MSALEARSASLRPPTLPAFRLTRRASGLPGWSAAQDARAWVWAARIRLASNRRARRVVPGRAGPQPLPGLLGLRVQALELEEVPVAQQRPQDLVVVDAQVIDASLSQLQGLAGKAVDADAGHVEANHLLGDRLDRGRGVDLEGGGH